ncbi:Zinc finger RING/FYVE/PHD-type protein [Lasiodiplodia theobromae]|nr:Zinc finger RING/FYVE/PHD-type protein [Lasiodiplodia theobromae]KAF4537569.1 Zinc finger RING/FYVE/PHD-type protein [Lasiodiplodia theobromae]
MAAQLDPTAVNIIGAMDEQSAALVLQLQLEDIATIFATAKGKGRADDSTADDAAYALRLHQQDLEASMVILEDRKMCQSIARAVQDDQHILAREAEAEAVAVRDRRLAHQMDGQPNAAATAAGSAGGIGFPGFRPSGEGEEEMSDRAIADCENLAKLTALYMSEADGAAMLSSGLFFDDDDEPKGESSSRAAKRQRTAAAIERRCEACRDDKKFFDVATVPHCRHDYCRDCLDQLFRLSMTDESLFPPRCCRQPISLDDVRMFLSTETAREFQRKKPELETPNKTYCHVQSCSAWIPPQSITDEVGVCPRCRLQTCTICKGSTHVGDCPWDEATQQLLQTADGSGWQRCYKCRRVVELHTGCNHITQTAAVAVPNSVTSAVIDGRLAAANYGTKPGSSDELFRSSNAGVPSLRLLLLFLLLSIIHLFLNHGHSNA